MSKKDNNGGIFSDVLFSIVMLVLIVLVCGMAIRCFLWAAGI